MRTSSTDHAPSVDVVDVAVVAVVVDDDDDVSDPALASLSTLFASPLDVAFDAAPNDDDALPVAVASENYKKYKIIIIVNVNYNETSFPPRPSNLHAYLHSATNGNDERCVGVARSRTKQ